MRGIIIPFVLCLLSFNAKCQPIVTDAGNKRIMEWNLSYQTESKYFRADSNYEIGYYYSVRKQSKLIAEYFRHNDISYLFVKYDTTGSRLQRGLIKYCSEVFDLATVQIPDYILDSDGSKGIYKDTSIYENSYRKNGIWWEKDSTGMIWKGEYKNGLREGKWQEGIEVCCNEMANRTNDFLYDLLRPYLTHMFVKGVEVLLYKDSLIWPKIKGSWYYHHDLKLDRLVFERSNESKDLKFIDRQKAVISELINRKVGFTKDNQLTAKWNQKEGILEFIKQEKTVRFHVLRLDDFYLILQLLN